MSFTPLEKSYIFLTGFEKLGWKQLRAMLDIRGAVELVKNFKNLKAEIIKVIGNELYEIMAGSLNPGYMQPKLDRLIEKGIEVITAESGDYPQDLLHAEEPPFILYALGDLSLLKTNLITVVGSRKSTVYGEEQTEKIVKGLCGSGFTVVSGLAEGIDTVANKTALKYGKTIAVVAGGFDRVYPQINEKLFGEIAEKGLILSEYPPETVAMPFMFPLRNRIMAAIGNACVITEAGEKSGAVITANLALNYGKELFVLPGNVNSPSSAGCNNLLKEMQGAIITGYEDILSAFGIETVKDEKNIEKKELNLSDREKSVLEILRRGETHIDQILSALNMTVKEANTVLSVMEIKGIIKKLPGNYFGI